MAQKPQVNIIAVVDVIGALSGRTLENGNLDLLDPVIVATAECSFGVPFVQGCTWG